MTNLESTYPSPHTSQCASISSKFFSSSSNMRQGDAHHRPFGGPVPIQGSVKPPAEGEGWPVALQTLNMWPYCLHFQHSSLFRAFCTPTGSRGLLSGASILNLGPLSRDLISSPVPAKSALGLVAARVGSRSVQSRTCVFCKMSPAPGSGSRDRVCILVVRGGGWWPLVSKSGESESRSLSPFPAAGHPGHRNSDVALEKSKTGKKALSLGGHFSKKRRVSSSGSCPLQRSRGSHFDFIWNRPLPSPADLLPQASRSPECAHAVRAPAQGNLNGSG